MLQYRFTVSGHVQGVGFRYFVRNRALELGLIGYAKNLYNGDVEVVVQGDENSIHKLELHLRQGPSRAKVDRVSIEKISPSDQLVGFNTF